MPSTLDDLSGSQFVLLTTYRRDGRAVATPLWVVRDDDALAVWTPTKSGKVKRLRRSGAVLVGPCDFRGNPLGEQVSGRAVIMDAVGSDRIRRLIRRKYGVMGWLTVNGSLLRRGRAGTVGIQITLS
jgi:PPOX class probable F420-dependent enzyme